MRQCNRCGEDNHDDARYCGTCGLSMPTGDGIESLVAEGGGPEDDTATGLGLGDTGLQTSEYVGAPSFGESGPVTIPAAAPPLVPGLTTVAPPPVATVTSSAVPPPSGPPPQYGQFSDGSPGPVPVPVVRSSRSTSLMIASLAVAAVVIIGGVFILLASGSKPSEVARTGEDPTASTPLETSAPATVAPVPSDAPTTEAPPSETTPSTTEVPVSAAPVESPVTVTVLPTTTLITAPPPTAPPATAAPAPEPTSPPAPEPTAPPPPPTRGPGDLGLTQPILNESCDGQYITFVGSAVGDRPYAAVVGELLDQYPGTNYIWTRACPSLRQEFTTGADIYGVVFGPYATQQEACNATAFGPNDAYVRRISTFDPQDHTIRC